MPYHVKKIPCFDPVPVLPQDYKSAVPDFDIENKNDADTISIARDYLEQCNQQIRQMVQAQRDPFAVHKIRSQMIDQLIVKVFLSKASQLNFDLKKESQLCSLLATGGYGREEMSLLSDIDLLLLYKSHPGNYYKPLIEQTLYVLWDLKLDVGHAVRTLDECQMMMRQEHTIMTSMLDLRLLTGSRILFDDLVVIRKSVLEDDMFRRRLIQSKINEKEIRLDRFGGSVYLLEPHIKEGVGGLRDLQMIRWLASIMEIEGGFQGLKQAGYLKNISAESLNLAFSYFLNLRNRLHLLTGTKNDQITFAAQISISKDLGFSDDEMSLGVEKFMQSYYALANQNKINLNNLIQKILFDQKKSAVDPALGIQVRRLDQNFVIHDDKIDVAHEKVFDENPLHLLVIFEHVQNTGLGLHFNAKELIAQNISKIDDAFRKSPVVCDIFKRMISNYKNLGKILFEMHEVHFFDELIPEFKKVRNRMQHDAYHVYTVDTHSLFAVHELSELAFDSECEKKLKSFKEVLAEIKRPDLLILGILLHDIGKGEGGDHSIIGAEIAKKVTKRLGYSEEDCQTVEFLVLSHLMMTRISQRRDLEDYQMITEFANAINSLKRLNMLYLLTWADIRAVSPEAWTAWKGELLQNLYEKTKKILLSQEQTENIVQNRILDVRNSILRIMGPNADQNKIEHFLHSISPRYVLAHGYEEIYEHYNVITSHDDTSLLFVDKEFSGDANSEILIYTIHNPRVVPLITGVMLSLGINILSMENFMMTDGHVIVKMRVQSQKKLTLQKAGLVEPLKKNLNDVFMGRTTVSTLLAKRKKPAFLEKQPLKTTKARVHIDNDVSAYYTVIDVHTYDRLGLLYDIVECLVRNGCYVDVSKISTNADRVVDSFYVKDIFGHKIMAKEKLNDIKRALIDVVEK